MASPSTDSQHSNALIQETSPYLLQHAHNPVQWYPWGEEALSLARQSDKPILLSIGYSACHWCHVMAHESFEDPATARVMNELFINIKVDREERPDLDKIYQQAHQLLTQRPGGWPLTMFLTADDHTPFFGGTYFPNQARHGLPSFTDLLRRVADFYQHHRDEVNSQNQSVRQALTHLSAGATDNSQLSAAPLQLARKQLEQSYDRRHAGFGQAPKFPQPSNLERLLRHWSASVLEGAEDRAALDMASTTLHAMASGGVYDQLGGGFCRYSVDDYWMIPHFEKMLYDNGPLLSLYVDAWQATGNGVFQRIARETADWVLREMQSPQGGFYATLDADSEGEEGRFYVWTPEQVQALLDEDEYNIIKRHYGLDRSANFEGHWHLHVFVGLEQISRDLNMDPVQASRLLASAREKLFQHRKTRIHPGRDEKVITSWNGLMIRALAQAGRCLQEPRYLQAAEQALAFIRDHLWRNGRLIASYKDGKAHLNAYLDDYVFLISGVLELLQTRWKSEDMEFVTQLADVVLDHFQDDERGGFFFTSDDHEQLIQRPKPLMDDALPAGNGIAAWVLGRMGHLLGEPRYLDAAQRCLQSAWAAIKDLPYAHNALLTALEEALLAPQVVILRGHGEALSAWQARCSRYYAPSRLCLAIPDDVQDLPGHLAERKPQGEVIAYICQATSCSAPVTSFEKLEEELKAVEPQQN